ncbi:MAG TPA: acyltransferase [Flavobacterium sp.]|nr:acyltransferase [Flavobacterium sp.]
MGLLNKFKNFFFVSLRIQKYKWLSDCRNVAGSPNLYHPLLLKGKGRIRFGSNVQIGVIASPNYYSHYSYIEARNEESTIVFGNNISINNNFSAVAFSGIVISDHVLIGVNCAILDNDGHHLDFDKRTTETPKSAAVFIGENVFLGDNVTILKGVSIGKNSIIGHSAVVTKDIPENSIAAGNPAVVIRSL